MGIYFPLCGENVGMIDPVDCYLIQQKCECHTGLEPRCWVEHGARRLALVLKRKTSQAFVWSWNATLIEVCVLKRQHDLRVLMKNTALAFCWCNARFTFKVETRPSRLTWDSHFEVLSLVIFRQRTKLPPKFSKPNDWLRRIFKIFWTSTWLGSSWLDKQSFEVPGAWSV